MAGRLMFNGAWRTLGEAEALLKVLNHPGHASQKSHGRRVGPISEEYTSLYGEVLDERTAGDDNEYVVAVTETGDMHLAFDDSAGGDREVFYELTPDTARTFADELRRAKDHSGAGEPDDEGIVDSAAVGGTDLEVWVHQNGDVGIRDVGEDGYPGFDVSNDDAAGLADALDSMADFHNEQFGG